MGASNRIAARLSVYLTLVALLSGAVARAQDDSFAWDDSYYDESVALLASVDGDLSQLDCRSGLIALRACAIASALAGEVEASERYLESAAEAGDPFSMNRVADMLLRKGPPHYAEAINLLSRAAALGYAPAAHNLGAEYWNGRTVPRDEAAARRYFAVAASEGFPPAMANYGLMLARGVGGVPDPEKGIEFLARAASAGDSRARFNLGVQYLRGNGVPQDEQEAIAHFRIAAAAGHVPAREALAVMEAEARP